MPNVNRDLSNGFGAGKPGDTPPPCKSVQNKIAPLKIRHLQTFFCTAGHGITVQIHAKIG